MKSIFTVIDISSSKITGAVVRNDGSALTVVAMEEEPLVGCMRHGCIANVEEVQTHLRRLIGALERNPNVAPRRIKGVYFAIGGRGMCSTPVTVERTLAGEQLITDEHLKNLQQDAVQEFSLSKPDTREIIDVFGRDFSINGRRTSKPVGTYGSTITATYTIVSWRTEGTRNLEYVAERCRINVLGYVVRPLAEAELVTNADERTLGCMVVDFGAHTTSVTMYRNNALQYLNTIPLGSHNITRDVAAIGLTIEKAEDYKRSIGNAMPEPASSVNDDDEEAVVVNNYIQARCHEIIANITAQLGYAGLEANEFNKGIMLVGRGSQLKNFPALLEQKTKMRVQIGAPIVEFIFPGQEISPVKYIDILALARYVAIHLNPGDISLTAAPKPPEHRDPGRVAPRTPDRGTVFTFDEEEPFEAVAPKRPRRKPIDDDDLLTDDEDPEEVTRRQEQARQRAQEQADREAQRQEREARRQARDEEEFRRREQKKRDDEEARRQREIRRQEENERKKIEKERKKKESERKIEKRRNTIDSITKRARNIFRSLTDSRTEEERLEDEEEGREYDD